MMSELASNDDDDAAMWSGNSSAATPNVTGFSDRLEFSCGAASLLLQTCTSRFSVVKTVLVPIVCVVGRYNEQRTVERLRCRCARRFFFVFHDDASFPVVPDAAVARI